MRDVTEKKPLNVLFLCTGNSARSIMAEVILNRAGQGKFKALSAGSQPKGEVHPYTLDLLRKLHYDVIGLRSKSWLEFSGPDAPKLDFVFTVCDNAAAETCPVWPGQPMTAHWGVPDPVAATGTEAERRYAFADALRMLTNRINIFVSLPLAKSRSAEPATAARCDRQDPKRPGNGGGMIDTFSFLHQWCRCNSRDPAASEPWATLPNRAIAWLSQNDQG